MTKPPIEPERPLRVGIVGGGPVGCTLAVHLKESGAYVVICDHHGDRVEAIRKDGIHLQNIIEKHARINGAVESVAELADHGLDLVIIAVKTPALGHVLAQLKDIDDGQFRVLCAQNGIDNELEIERRFGNPRTMRMVVNFAGAMTGPNTVRVSFFNPPNYVACISDEKDPVAMRVAELLNSVGMETQVPFDIQDHVWAKAILNAALNGVCTIMKRPMKDIMDFQPTYEMVEGLIDECVAVAEREGLHLGTKFRRYSIRYLKNAGPHRPSMLVDLERGNPTEIAYLNERMVEYGGKHCLPTPLNRAVSAMVRMLEHSGRA